MIQGWAITAFPPQKVSSSKLIMLVYVCRVLGQIPMNVEFSLLFSKETCFALSTMVNDIHMASYFDGCYLTLVIIIYQLLNDLCKLNHLDLKLIFASKENLLLALITTKETLTIESLPHSLKVAIVFSAKYWGIDVGFKSRDAHVLVLQIGSINKLKELADL